MYFINKFKISWLPFRPSNFARILCVPMLPNNRPRSVICSMPAIPELIILTIDLLKPLTKPCFGLFTLTVVWPCAVDFVSPTLILRASDDVVVEWGSAIFFRATWNTLESGHIHVRWSKTYDKKWSNCNNNFSKTNLFFINE